MSPTALALALQVPLGAPELLVLLLLAVLLFAPVAVVVAAVALWYFVFRDEE